MQKAVYKVPGGKLLKISYLIEDGVIQDIEIRGDFFMYPEDAVSSIEAFLKGKSAEFVEGLEDFLNTENIEIFGFSAQDLYDAINNAN